MGSVVPTQLWLPRVRTTGWPGTGCATAAHREVGRQRHRVIEVTGGRAEVAEGRFDLARAERDLGVVGAGVDRVDRDVGLVRDVDVLIAGDQQAAVPLRGLVDPVGARVFAEEMEEHTAAREAAVPAGLFAVFDRVVRCCSCS